jgi:DNA repair protein SbcC/Rad50
MRPRELTLEGFKSYRASTTFDWRDRRLVGIVGPIGAGKSSILDAISFALYGKTPNVERDTKTLIHQLSDQCHVELRFEVDGQTWRAQRALRRKGQAGHRLELLAADDPEAEVLERVNGERDVNARIEQLLGMDFKAFCRSVLLAQNRFQEFLRATPGDRDKVLKGVFGYDRLDGAQRTAKLRLEAITLELDAFGKERIRIDEARTHLEAARAEAEATAELLARLEGAAAEVERLRKEREAAAGEAEAAQARITELRDIAGGLPPQEDLEAAVAAAGEAGAGVAEAQEALDAAKRERATADAVLADVTSRLGDRRRFRSFEALAHTHETQVREVARLGAAAEAATLAATEAERQAAERTAVVEAARAGAEEAGRALGAADAAVEDARSLVLRAQHAEMARTLRGELHAGDACPVCDQPVHAVPRARAAPKTAAAERTLAKAAKQAEVGRAQRERAASALSAAEASSGAAQGAIASTRDDEAGARAQHAEAQAALAATRSQLVEWLGEEGEILALFEAREAELTAAEEAVAAAKDGVADRQEGLDRAKELAAGAAQQLATLANRLAGSWGRLGRDDPVAAETGAVRAALVDLRETVVAAHDEAVTHGEEAGARRAEAEDALAGLFAAVGLDPRADFGAALAGAGVRHGAATARVAELEGTIERAGDLEAEILGAESRRDVADRLARDLQPSRFLAFLLEEERAELAELGSEHLDQLTDGSYRFSEDDRFDIVDLNAADQVRRSESLSGGETFLASLALALALAQMVARGGGRLDAFFLDEGFGSLDPDHLDRAMEGIGRLVAGDDRRLVVLVSHVAEMREAIEDLIVLTKDHLTGDTVVVGGNAIA